MRAVRLMSARPRSTLGKVHGFAWDRDWETRSGYRDRDGYLKKGCEVLQGLQISLGGGVSRAVLGGVLVITEETDAVNNCFIHMRENDDVRLLVEGSLENYALVPREEYEVLLKGRQLIIPLPDIGAWWRRLRFRFS